MKSNYLYSFCIIFIYFVNFYFTQATKENKFYKLHIVDWTDKLPNNYDNREKFLVLHHTGSKSAEKTLEAFKENRLSVHYIVDRDGTIYNLVKDQERARDAGISNWGNRSNLNDTSIGIEIVNFGNEPIEQIDTVAALPKHLMKKYKIKPQNIVGHSDIAPDRKSDPSGYFDWKRFYNYLGIFNGLYDTKLTQDQQRKVLLSDKSQGAREQILNLQKNLAKYGYKISQTGKYDEQTKNVVQAFNRHFAQEIFKKETVVNWVVVDNPENQRWYGISQERLEFLLKKYT